MSGFLWVHGILLPLTHGNRAPPPVNVQQFLSMRTNTSHGEWVPITAQPGKSTLCISPSCLRQVQFVLPPQTRAISISVSAVKGWHSCKVCHRSLHKMRMQAVLCSIPVPCHLQPTCLNESGNYPHPALELPL